MVTVWMRRRTLGMALTLAAAAAGGCKSGSSWTAKPSWWTFGDASKDPAALASAPPAPTDVTKPSAAAKPYPTTTTPEGYVLDNAQRGGQTQVASAAASSPLEPAAVTYGSTPVTPPAVSQAAAAPPTATATPGSLSSITPQVGPYGGAPGSPAGDQSLPATSTAGYAALPASSAAMAAPPAAGSAFGAAAATSPGFDASAARVADARGSEAWPAPPATPAAAGDSRYGGMNGSRFSGGMTAMPAATPAMDQSMPAMAPAEITPPAAPAVMPGAVPGSVPAAPSSLAPPTPTRRPDPGYRPGGTSSYRPSRTILAGDAGDAPSAVQPASYEQAMPAG